MNVRFNDLGAQWKLIKENCNKEFDKLFEKSNFILGEPVQDFEKLFADYIGTKFAIGVSNGTSALKLAALSLDVDEENTCFVIPALTYIATLGGIEQAYPHSTYKLIDCDDYFQMDVDILESFVAQNRQKYKDMVIVPVHLYGYACDMTKICEIAKSNNCYILEDASQAHGAKWQNKKVGSFGDVAAFSLYPGKNLGAAGDAGVITTNKEHVYQKILALRNQGSIVKYKHIMRGGNHRLDTIQAIVLKEKMPYIEDWNENRRGVVRRFETKINNQHVKLPDTHDKVFPVHHVYPVLVKDRNKFCKFLDSCKIQWGVHYPECIEQMDMYTHLSNPSEKSIGFTKEMVSLPIHPFMSDQEVDYMCESINKYEG